MKNFQDGAKSDLFTTINIKGQRKLHNLQKTDVLESTIKVAEDAPFGKCTMWGIPFDINNIHILKQNSKINIELDNVKSNYILFAHTAEQIPLSYNKSGFIHPAVGPSGLNNLLANYIIVYEDNSEEIVEIRNRQQIGTLNPNAFEDPLQAVAHGKDFSIDPMHTPENNIINAFQRQGQTNSHYSSSWVNWLCAIENPYPAKKIKSIRLEGCQGNVIISGITVADIAVSEYPLRWQTRMKAVFTLPKSEKFNSNAPDFDHIEFNKIIDMDLGQITSIKNLHDYPSDWKTISPETRHSPLENKILVDFTGHPNAKFYIPSTKETIYLNDLISKQEIGSLKIANPAREEIKIKVIDKNSQKQIAVRLHMHGEVGEYLHPMDRHYNPSRVWFNDYGAESIESNSEFSCYINGFTNAFLPLGKVYIQIWKGFEYRPLRTIFEIKEDTKEITIELEKELNWKNKKWISTDTHTHFMSPSTALLESASQDVNMVNILASSWGDMFTNTGDFDGHTHKMIDGNNETYLSRVGLEARQRVLGHMSLCGFEPPMITPMGAGGATAMPIGDAVEINLCEWARMCRNQNGLAFMSHFGHPRAAGAILIVNELCDGVETELFPPFTDYALSDIYQYFNCGYQLTLLAGTDKMGAGGKIGWSRVYSKLKDNESLSLDSWKESIKTGNTFVTQGPLLEFSINDLPAGSVIDLQKGDEIKIDWECKTTRGELLKVQLISGSDTGGKIINEASLPANGGKGSFSFKVEKSTWVAILTRGIRDANEVEDITAHSSTVMLHVDGKKPFSKIDAETIKDQIEGTYNYLNTIAIRPKKQKFDAIIKDTVEALNKINNRIINN